ISGRLTSVEWHCRSQVRNAHSHHVGDPSTKAEANDARFASAPFVFFQVFKSCDKVFQHFVAIAFRLQCATIVVVTRIASQWSKCVRRQRNKSGQGSATPYVRDMRIEATIFMNDNYPR